MSKRTKDKCVLGFDPGSTNGFGVAVLTDTAFILETLCVAVKSPRNSGRSRYEDLMNNLWSVLEIAYDKYCFSHLFYEQIHAHSGVYAAHKYGAQIGMIQFFCSKHKIKFDGINVQHAKIALAGFSMATKKHMVLAAQRMGYDGENHNEADAIGIALAGMRKHFLDERIKML